MQKTSIIGSPSCSDKGCGSTSRGPLQAMIWLQLHLCVKSCEENDENRCIFMDLIPQLSYGLLRLKVLAS